MNYKRLYIITIYDIVTIVYKCMYMSDVITIEIYTVSINRSSGYFIIHNVAIRLQP